jgi:hypothetical protein
LSGSLAAIGTRTELCFAQVEWAFLHWAFVTFPCDFPHIERLEGGSGKASRRVMLGDLPSTIQCQLSKLFWARQQQFQENPRLGHPLMPGNAEEFFKMVSDDSESDEVRLPVRVRYSDFHGDTFETAFVVSRHRWERIVPCHVQSQV